MTKAKGFMSALRPSYRVALSSAGHRPFHVIIEPWLQYKLKAPIFLKVYLIMNMLPRQNRPSMTAALASMDAGVANGQSAFFSHLSPVCGSIQGVTVVATDALPQTNGFCLSRTNAPAQSAI